MNEEIIKHYLNEIRVCMPVEIVSVDEATSLCTVKPLLFSELEELELPLIVKCPFLHIGDKETNLKYKVKKGHRLMGLFSQLDLSLYIAQGLTGKVNSTHNFSFTNCVILPIRALTEVDGINVPSFDFELTGSLKINGDVELNGNLTHNGNTTQEGSTTVSEKITTKDLLASGTSEFKGGTTIQGKPFLKHSHSGVQTGNGSTGGVS